MFIEMKCKTIYTIYFKKCAIYVNSFSGVFLSNDKNNLSIKDSLNRTLLNKFNVDDWDEYTTDLVHIKFLAKYSPILSKFINFEEFNNIKIQTKYYKSIAWGDVYYIRFNNGLKFFNTEEVDFDTETLYININSKFSQILKSFEK